MRNDGTVTYFLIQHLDLDGRVSSWTSSSLDQFLFVKLSYEDNRGEIGDRRRKLLAPQSSSSPMWQRFGANGFTNLAAADLVLDELYGDDHGSIIFRVVRRTVTQETEVVT